MVAGDIRRKVEDSKPLDYEDLALTCDGIEEPRDSCLIALLYLSGRRLNEVLHLAKSDFKVESNRISFETFNEKDYRKTQQGDYTLKRYVKQVPFINRKSEPYEGELYYRRIRPHWITDTPSGKALSKFITERLDSLSDNGYLFRRLNGDEKYISKNRAYTIIRYYLPDAWPHLLRHERFTEIAKVYKNDPVATHRYTFHKRFESTLQYIRNLEEELI